VSCTEEKKGGDDDDSSDEDDDLLSLMDNLTETWKVPYLNMNIALFFVLSLFPALAQ
jgi:hypothetical protein